MFEENTINCINQVNLSLHKILSTKILLQNLRLCFKDLFTFIWKVPSFSVFLRCTFEVQPTCMVLIRVTFEHGTCKRAWIVFSVCS